MTYPGAFILTATALFCAAALYLLSGFLAPKRPSRAKNAAYECGFDSLDAPQKNARHPLNVKFYRVGLLFLIFDVEIALLLPWVLSFESAGLIGFVTAMTLLAILTAGFIYEWKEGALSWR